MDIIAEIQADIKAIERNAALFKENNFDERANAIDFIDFHLIDRLEGLLPDIALSRPLDRLKQRAAQIKAELGKIDTGLFKRLRRKIRADSYAKSTFIKLISKYVWPLVSDTGRPDVIGYDNLDLFINGLLSDQPTPEAASDEEPEMIFYQKTPARIIFEMAAIAQMRKGDVFFDIGSGLGQAAILMNLISGLPAKGVEYEPVYCNYAKACALQLNLSAVEFINADARKADYSQGTVFFMYTPFEGSMLQEMLEVLKEESLKRPVSVFTYGPCSPHVAGQSWLNCINGPADDPYQLYEFKSLDSLSMI